MKRDHKLYRMESMDAELELEGLSHQQCAIKVAALLEGASSRHAADGLLQALLRSQDRTLNTIGLLPLAR